MSVSWETEKSTGRIRPTLVARARKRAARVIGGGRWVVDGDPKLGDNYTSYLVTRDVGGGKYRCECQRHAGGEYRGLCSHIVRIMLGLDGEMDWDEAVQVGGQDGDPLPVTDIPLSPAPPPEPLVRSGAHGLEDYDWGPHPLPGWVEGIRAHQVPAVDEVVRLFQEGKKVVMVDAPTGSGKTLIGELVRRKLQVRKAAYTCTTKTLQDQVHHDYPYAAVLKGRANYPTADHPELFPTVGCDLCDEQLVSWPGCDRCKEDDNFDFGDEIRHCPRCHPWDASGYQVAREAARRAWLTVTNTAYLLREVRGKKSVLVGAGLYILDEADQLESELMRTIEVGISEKWMRRLGLKPPKKVTVATSWLEWVEKEAIVAAKAELKGLPSKRHSSDRQIRDRNMLEKLVTGLTWLTQPREDGEPPRLLENFVLDGYNQGKVVFRPVKVDEFAQEWLWGMGNKFLLMSATIISPEQVAEDLGLEDDEWGAVTVPSTFDPAQRPVYVVPSGKMTRKEMAEELPKMASTISSILDVHNERILIHTVSYNLAEELERRLRPYRGRIIRYRGARERDEALSRFLSSTNGVLLAPSFDRGIDLADDACRVQVIAKVPYPYLGDKQVSKRLYGKGGQSWYSMMTIRTIVQMTGRSMRSADDSCQTYLLDTQFLEVWRRDKKLIPMWWQEAIEWGGANHLGR